MAQTSTWGFASVTMVISHPTLGQYTANGAGIGTISQTMTTDRTQHDVAADGAVMVSKIEGNNGTYALSVQQTSALNQWLTNAYNYARTADPAQWALFKISLVVPAMNMQYSATGVSFQILPEQTFEAAGQLFSWSLMAADISSQVL